MKRIYCSICLIVILFFGMWSNLGQAQNEAVKGHHDVVNDWFVFEWDRPEYGKTVTIYDPPNKIKPAMSAQVDFNKKNSDYIYAYQVANNVGARQNLLDIVIRYRAPIYDVKAPSPAQDWYSSQYRGKDAWHWLKGDGILPDKTEEGFSFKSKGLPTIVNSAFLGNERSEFSPPGDYDTDEVADSFERVFKGLEEKYKEKFAYVTKKTLGPVAPPAELKPLEFVDTIIKMKHEASSLGWIKNDGIEKSLDAKLDNAKKKLEQGSPRAAANILTAFINEVEAQGCATYDNCPPGKHLTSEAYALLKYNAQYLIDNLK